jgi:hypothetical protein
VLTIGRAILRSKTLIFFTTTSNFHKISEAMIIPIAMVLAVWETPTMLVTNRVSLPNQFSVLLIAIMGDVDHA